MQSQRIKKLKIKNSKLWDMALKKLRDKRIPLEKIQGDVFITYHVFTIVACPAVSKVGDLLTIFLSLNCY